MADNSNLQPNQAKWFMPQSDGQYGLCEKKCGLVRIFYVKAFHYILAWFKVFIHQPMIYILIVVSNNIGLDEFPPPFAHIIHSPYHAIEFYIFIVFILNVVAFER